MADYEIGAKLRTEPVFPVAGVVRTDGAELTSAETQPLSPGLARVAPEEKSPAQWAYERLILYVQKFEETLDADQEVGLGFAGSDGGSLHIQGMGFFAPDLVTFYGVDQTGARTQLVQHVSQLNVMLKAAPKMAQAPNRIGFRLREKMEANAAEADTDGATDTDGDA